MTWEKRFVTADRRPSSAEGSSSEGTSSVEDRSEGDSRRFVGLVGSEGLGSSANPRLCDRILHDWQIDARYETCRDREAADEAIESKIDLGPKRTGCIALREQVSEVINQVDCMC